MEINEIKKAIAGLDASGLADLAASLKQAQEGKRSGVDISTIRPGMSPDEAAAARAEINRLLATR